MDVQFFAKTFFESAEQINAQLKTAIDLGTSLYTIGSAGVKILQHGKQLVTYAIGKTKPGTKPSKARKKTKRGKSSGDVILPKGDVAIVVEISRPSVQDVVDHLERKKIDANLVVITTIKARGQKSVKGLNENRPSEWTGLVKEFSEAIDKIKQEIGASAKIHIFLSTPLALAFGLGAVWGTVDRAQVYHWKSSGGYAPLMKINRQLRFQD